VATLPFGDTRAAIRVAGDEARDTDRGLRQSQQRSGDRPQGIAALTTFDKALCVPAVVYATPAKYQVPAARLLMV